MTKAATKCLRLLTAPLLTVALCSAISGCGRHDAGRVLFATAVVAATVATQHPELLESEHREVDPNDPSRRATPVTLDPPRPVDPSGAAPFDAARARAALDNVDLIACREVGAPHGQGHAKMALHPSGAITDVVVDAPAALPPEAVKCICSAFGRATVPVFRGHAVSFETKIYIP